MTAWDRIPGLRRLPLFGLVFRANRDARRAHASVRRDPAFGAPRRWVELDLGDYDTLLLPAGHRARGMREYLESPLLQNLVTAFFTTDKPVAAIGHGVLLAARSRWRVSGASALFGRQTTALTWALESKAQRTTRVTRCWDPHYHRTQCEADRQPDGDMSVQHEVTRALAAPADFLDVSRDEQSYRCKTNGMARDSAGAASPAFAARDGNCLSVRWPVMFTVLQRCFR